MLTARIEKIRQNYVNAKPQISCERAALRTQTYKRSAGKPDSIPTPDKTTPNRAALWTESYKRSAGKPVCIRSADKSTAFRVGAAGCAGIRDKGHFL